MNNEAIKILTLQIEALDEATAAQHNSTSHQYEEGIGSPGICKHCHWVDQKKAKVLHQQMVAYKLALTEVLRRYPDLDIQIQEAIDNLLFQIQQHCAQSTAVREQFAANGLFSLS